VARVVVKWNTRDEIDERIYGIGKVRIWECGGDNVFAWKW
jgi:hypothetical protein